jgi:hypothetical protein
VLRSDYAAIQRLMWDGELRRRFVADPRGELVPGLSPSLARRISTREVAGIEESAYYRIASCARAIATVFEHGSVLLNAFGGLRYLETLLRDYLDAPAPMRGTYELFDGYILAPRAIHVARTFDFDEGARWIVDVLEFEWAVWHSRRCALGWEPLVRPPASFKRPVFLLGMSFELQALIDDIVRMRAANVPEAVYRWRCIPNFGRSTFLLVFDTGNDIGTVELTEDAYDNVRGYMSAGSRLDADLHAVLTDHGVV